MGSTRRAENCLMSLVKSTHLNLHHILFHVRKKMNFLVGERELLGICWICTLQKAASSDCSGNRVWSNRKKGWEVIFLFLVFQLFYWTDLLEGILLDYLHIQAHGGTISCTCSNKVYFLLVVRGLLQLLAVQSKKKNSWVVHEVWPFKSIPWSIIYRVVIDHGVTELPDPHRHFLVYCC